MSNIYLTEPPTCGKVLLETSFGDIDIELFSKEAPLACRNFVQLALEGYYDNCPVHRVIKKFMVQTGDPTGTGTGGSSIWGKPFKDECHPRVKFNHRGLVAMANEQRPNSNQSQFFITLDACEWLNKKHTIFGKITGVTMFNLLRLNDAEVDADDKPVDPIRINRCQVLMNPFEDIVPRDLKSISAAAATAAAAAADPAGQVKAKEPSRKATRDLKLLSFGGDDEEEQADGGSEVSSAPKKKSGEEKQGSNPGFAATSISSTTAVASAAAAAAPATATETAKAPTFPRTVPPPRAASSNTVPPSEPSNPSNAVAKEFQEVRDALLRSKRAVQVLTGQGAEQARKEVAKSSVLTPLEQIRQQYQKRKADHGDREKETLERLNRFSENIKKAKLSSGAASSAPAEAEHYHGQVMDEDLLAGEATEDWHVGKLVCKSHIDDRFRAGDGRSADDYVVLDDRI